VIEVTGSMKFDVTAAPAMSDVPDVLRRRIGARPVFLAASTREGEEALLLQALVDPAVLPAATLVVIVPRHPQRFGEVAALLARLSLRHVRRSDNLAVTADCRFLLGDSLGEMAAYYAVADCAFVGGSLLPLGGQNLIEACAAGVPVIIGPHTFNFAQAATAAIEAGAAVRVPDAAAAVREARQLLLDARKRDAMSQAGLAFCRRHQGATARVLAICDRLLAPGTS
jgi:3-deoxy-D-manno-octulosonic-acid transferase